MKADTLKIGWCDHKAALYAVKNWHYSQSLPPPPLVRVGVWEAGEFIGCVLFGRGASSKLGGPYELNQTQCCELVRVALRKHTAPVTRIIKIALVFLKRNSPGLRLVVSFADPAHGHIGGIYQGGNWIYAGKTHKDYKYIDSKGREWHSRQVSKTGVSKQYGQYRRAPKRSECTKREVPGKFRYLMPLDKKMAAQVEHLRQPYPKRGESIDSDAPAVLAGEGGATPTSPLHDLPETGKKG